MSYIEHIVSSLALIEYCEVVSYIENIVRLMYFYFKIHIKLIVWADLNC